MTTASPGTVPARGAGLLRRFLRKECLWLALIVLVGAGLRLVRLDADPPATELSGRGAFQADEGLYAHAAAVLADTGSLPPTGDYMALPFTPLYSLATWAAMEIGGVNLVAARSVGAICGVLLLLVIYGALRNWDLPPAACLAAVFLLSIDSLMIAYQRLALLESPLMLGAASTLWLWSLGDRYVREGRACRWPWWAAGAALGLSLTVKSTALFFAGVLAVAALLGEGRLSDRFFRLLRAGAACCLVVAVWVGTTFLLWPDDWTNYILLMRSVHIYKSTAADPAQGLSNLLKFFSSPIVFYKTPLAAAGILLFPLVRRRPAARVLAAWALLGALFVGNFAYQPLRYKTIVVLPLVLLAGMAAAEAYARRASGARLLPALAVAVLLGSVAFHLPRVVRWLGKEKSMVAAAETLSAHVEPGALVMGDVACMLHVAGADWRAFSTTFYPVYYGPTIIAEPPDALVTGFPDFARRFEELFPQLGTWELAAEADYLGNYYRPYGPMKLYKRVPPP